MTIPATLRPQQVTVTPVTSGAADSMGNPVDVEGTPATYAAKIQPVRRDEDTVDRDTAVSDWSVWLPNDAVVDHRSRVTIDGRDYEVLGEPYRAWTPLGEHHVKITVRLIEG